MARDDAAKKVRTRIDPGTTEGEAVLIIPVGRFLHAADLTFQDVVGGPLDAIMTLGWVGDAGAITLVKGTIWCAEIFQTGVSGGEYQSLSWKGRIAIPEPIQGTGPVVRAVIHNDTGLAITGGVEFTVVVGPA